MPPPRHDASASLLHAYKLCRQETRTVPARSNMHTDAELRLNKKDLYRLRSTTAGQDYEPIVGLFSTGYANEAIMLQAPETIWIQMSKGARPKRSRKKAQPSTKRGGLDAELRESDWQQMHVTASHAYVRGLRVSGVIHRAVVRLVRCV